MMVYLFFFAIIFANLSRSVDEFPNIEDPSIVDEKPLEELLFEELFILFHPF